MPRLYSEHVELRYAELSAPVVDDLSLEVRDGAITTIIGPNGCGKSTLLRALGRMLKPSDGSVVLDGQLIHQLPTKEVARRLGLLHQQASVPEGITVEDLARRGRYPHQGFLQPPTRRDLDVVERARTERDDGAALAQRRQPVRGAASAGVDRDGAGAGDGPVVAR
jgi:iron complex transport system ATP-binding protein